ncbi:acyltransferase [Piscinibacter gummiphilus]|uniref:Acyltransferase n=1 Tax=Piscinibacter gummiphilus TaxID=946333 RepID=A0ABZ0CX75_9BURK|nr:acyltransferase [Piscinibacter gummiphilus]WOB07620.1 acyltransferase [Piscinibacter gummiphilus]
MAQVDTTRHDGLDRLKAGLTLLVVFHHTAITYGGAGGWFYRELTQSDRPSSIVLTFFCAINQAWFMGLFFLIAGYFTPRALEHKSAARFLGDKLVRLGIPLLVFGWLLGPATIALVQSTLRERDFTQVLAALWQRGVFEQGPLWFATALLIMALASLLVHRVAGWPQRGTRPPPSDRQLLAAALVCGAAAFALRLVWPVGTTWWGLQLGYFAGYTILYVAGNLAAQHGWLDRMPEPQVRRWRRIAWCTVPLLAPLALLKDAVPLFQGNPMGGWNLPGRALRILGAVRRLGRDPRAARPCAACERGLVTPVAAPVAPRLRDVCDPPTAGGGHRARMARRAGPRAAEVCRHRQPRLCRVLPDGGSVTAPARGAAGAVAGAARACRYHPGARFQARPSAPCPPRRPPPTPASPPPQKAGCAKSSW